MSVDHKLLLSHLSAKCVKAVEGALASAIRSRSREVTIEHVFLALLEDRASEFTQLVDNYQLDLPGLRSALQQAAGGGNLAAGARPILSPTLFQWLEEAWLLTSLELGRLKITSGVLFLKLIQQAGKYGGALTEMLESIPPEYVKKDLATVGATAQEAAAEQRWSAGDVALLAEFAADAGAPAGYDQALTSLRQWLAELKERGSGLSLVVEQNVCMLRAIGGAPVKVAPTPAPTPAPAPTPVRAAEPAAPAAEPAPSAPPVEAPPPAHSAEPEPTAVAESPVAAPTVTEPSAEPTAPPAVASAPEPPHHEEAPPPSRAAEAPKADAHDTKSLLKRLTKTCVGALERAANHAVRERHAEITPEHFLYELIGEANADVASIVAHYALDTKAMRRALDAKFAEMRQGTTRPAFAPQLLDWLHDGDLSPNNPNGPKIRSGLLFFRFVQQTRKYTKRGANLGLESIPFDDLKRILPTLLSQSKEAAEV
ncbi:MAG: Clp protease N-terminal domain-containing protein [Polyangiaceae bacterium]